MLSIEMAADPVAWIPLLLEPTVAMVPLSMLIAPLVLSGPDAEGIASGRFDRVGGDGDRPSEIDHGDPVAIVAGGRDRPGIEGDVDAVDVDRVGADSRVVTNSLVTRVTPPDRTAIPPEPSPVVSMAPLSMVAPVIAFASIPTDPTPAVVMDSLAMVTEPA